jgi:hypothetical protein
MKTKILLICGPWGSGSSALTGFLAHAGFFCPEPYHMVPDPLTPKSFETDAFRLALAPFVSEPKLVLIGEHSKIIESLLNFKNDFLMKKSNHLLSGREFFMLKHPTSSFFLNELSQIFDISVLVVLRSFDDIELTRKRRKWPIIFGAKGAKVIYEKIFTYLIQSKTKFECIRYDEMLANPELILSKVSTFSGVSFTQDEIKSAISFVSAPR